MKPFHLPRPFLLVWLLLLFLLLRVECVPPGFADRVLNVRETHGPVELLRLLCVVSLLRVLPVTVPDDRVGSDGPVEPRVTVFHPFLSVF